ncbi:MAG: hypothetical protein KAT32_00215 [Candidatus Moranbacteria bacterium]|nr:hypothetical protein [Candidatus Moranbacteria bacterium]
MKNENWYDAISLPKGFKLVFHASGDMDKCAVAMKIGASQLQITDVIIYLKNRNSFQKEEIFYVEGTRSVGIACIGYIEGEDYVVSWDNKSVSRGLRFSEEPCKADFF